MEIMVVKPLYIEEVAKVVKNVEKKYCVKKFVVGVHIGARIAKIIKHQKRVHMDPFKKFLPGIELFSQGATPQIFSPLMRFTTEFEMDRSGSTSP